ncbi:MAG: hypothetical protein ACJ8CC_24305, partial [Microvirga sp.]
GGSLRGLAAKPSPRTRGEEIGVPTILSFIHRFRSCRPTTPPASSGETRSPYTGSAAVLPELG